MRSVNAKWKKPTSRRAPSEFTFDNITALLFDDVFPTRTVFPFRQWKHSIYRDTPVVISVKHSHHGIVPLDDFYSCILSIGKYSTEGAANVLSLSSYLYSIIYGEYLNSLSDWWVYFYDNIKEYSKSPISVAQWNIFKYSGVSGLKLPEKAIWATMCTTSDREFWTDFAISLRESLLGWLNPEMYERMKEREENTRYNVEYDKQRRAMIDGELDSLSVKLPQDIKEQLRSDRRFSDDDLDVVK